jgi:hypothetical protein
MNLKSRKIKLNAVRHVFFAACIACVSGFVSCGDDKSDSGAVYDPSQPVVRESFYPDSGGMATKVMISGKNFGSDVSKIRVWYNDKQAAVISSNGDHLYVVTPKQPGEISTISVVVGQDSAVMKQTFKYRIMTTVSTVTGQKGSTVLKDGTLSEASFIAPRLLCIDNENNLFLCHWDAGNSGHIILINEEQNIVRTLATPGRLGAPAVDATGKIVVVPTDGGFGYYAFDADAQWAPKSTSILQPSAEAQANGVKPMRSSYKQGFATSPADGMVYSYFWNGDLIKFDPLTRTGELVATLNPNTHGIMATNPTQPDLVYVCLIQGNAIYTYNVLTGDWIHYAGALGTTGWRDGPRLEAEFGGFLSQVVFDEEGSLIVADVNNHCIRKITTDGMVSTIIGQPKKAGYVDGNADDALFDQPYGMAIDKDYNIYIADQGNNCIRKLSIE